MCGRYGVTDVQHIGERFQFSLALDLSGIPPRYNAAPTQRLPVITEQAGQRRLDVLTWGLVPSWAKDRTRPVINARAEGIQDKPTFRTPFRRSRCLVPATFFFEWQAAGKAKHPYLIRPTDQALFAFAGLYDVHRDPVAGDLHSFAIVTTEPNALVAPIHHRMPVILRPDDEGVWLDPATSALELQLLLGPYPAERMEAYPVGPAVNSARNDGPALLARA
jgi:putative SOS response-associated peptidase YedK